jgi:hypothetical protein
LYYFPVGTDLLVVQHLEQVEADLLEANRVLAQRLTTLVSHLPPADPDRDLLATSIRDLTLSIGQAQRRLTESAR